MNTDQQRALLTLALYAGFADGHKADSEREAIRRMAESLSDAQGGHPLASLYQDVLLRRVSVADAVAAQTMAAPPSWRAGAAAAAAAPTAAAGTSTTQDAELDKAILNAAILNGALELLPQSWASMAIIPLQIRLVYRIGQAHGVELDQGHIKEFIAAAGIGMTSQYIEQFGRKLLGGLVGKALGKTMGKVGGAATGMAFSFATTYALGQLAKRYYAGGRVMDAALLRSTYEDLLAPARQMQTQYLPQIRERAATLDAGKVMALVRGG